MRSLSIVLLSVMMAGYLAQAQTAETTYFGPEGFATFGYGSSVEYVKTEMNKDGYELTESDPGALWYLGDLEGYVTDFVYLFDEEGTLTGGIFLVRARTTEAYTDIQMFLARTYPNQVTIKITGASFRGEFHGPDTRIVHVNDDESHRIQYYEASNGN